MSFRKRVLKIELYAFTLSHVKNHIYASILKYLNLHIVSLQQLTEREQEEPNSIRRPQSARSFGTRSITAHSTRSRTSSAKGD